MIPSAPGCLRGLDDLNKDLLAANDNPRLQTFVVHVPVIGAEAKDVAPAGKLLHNAHVHHYWNPTGEFGRQLAEATGLRNRSGPVYAWDVWLVYDAQAEWHGSNPPPPKLLMHQLRALNNSARFPPLDSKVFAREVQTLLADLPAAPAASTTRE